MRVTFAVLSLISAACADPAAEREQPTALVAGSTSTIVPAFGVGWAREVGGEAADGEASQTIGDVYAGPTRAFIAGSWSGTIDFGDGYAKSGPGGPFVASVAADGRLRWRRAFADFGSFLRITGTTDEDVVVSGERGGGNGDFGCGITPPSIGFLAEYDGATGVCRWMRVWQTTGFYAFTGLRAEPDGDLAVVGRFAGTVDLGGGHVIDSQTSDPVQTFVARLDGRGHARWVRVLGDTGPDSTTVIEVLDLATDAAGNVYVPGSFHGSADLAGTIFESGPSQNGFVVAFDGGGALRWRYLDHEGGVQPLLADVGTRRLAVAAAFTSQFTFAGQRVVGDDLGGMVVLDFGLDGHQRWARVVPRGTTDLVVDEADRVNLAGDINEVVGEFGNLFFSDGRFIDVFRSILAVLDANDGSPVRAGALGDWLQGSRISFARGNGLRLMSASFKGPQRFDKIVLTPRTGGLHAAYMSLIKVEPPVRPPSFERTVTSTGLMLKGDIATGDFDGDGRLDLIVPAKNSEGMQGTYLLRGQGDGSFSAPSLVNGECCAGGAAADVNGDGRLDLVVSSGARVRSYLGIGGGTSVVKSPAPVSSHAPVIADFDGDGIPDVALIVAGGGIAVLLGDGDGHFEPPTVVRTFGGYESTAILAGDLDGDGVPDLAAVTGPVGELASGALSVFLGQGDGTFIPSSDVFPSAYPVQIAKLDFDRDGKADLAVANTFISDVTFYRGGGDGTFVPQVELNVLPIPGASSVRERPPQHIAVADFNGDGVPDVAIDTPFSVLTGDRFGRWYGTDFDPSCAANAMRIGDFDGDGKPDVVVTCGRSGVVSVYRNTTASPGTP